MPYTGLLFEPNSGPQLTVRILARPRQKFVKPSPAQACKLTFIGPGPTKNVNVWPGPARPGPPQVIHQRQIYCPHPILPGRVPLSTSTERLARPRTVPLSTSTERLARPRTSNSLSTSTERLARPRTVPLSTSTERLVRPRTVPLSTSRGLLCNQHREACSPQDGASVNQH